MTASALAPPERTSVPIARSPMPTPGFPPTALDSAGDPIWVSDLASVEPNHTLHVVKGLEPAEALEVLGANPRLFRTCELPDAKADVWSSLVGKALGIEPGDSAALLAGRIGAWTFVYDDAGFTSPGPHTISLSADGSTAASSLDTINADASLSYAVNGEELAFVDVNDLDLGADLPGMPAELRAAFDAAGVFDDEDIAPGEVDHAIGMRVVCALAGLVCTLDDLRRITLTGVPFG
ncbi:DUF6461 domain-containing protein [Lentzea sp. NPDC059081]|uniref:DUF6461 domain-containing protein n=1 Tax=Lentzea sp. NPDC059081 TaxID=3346719 RepID=UPI003694EE35